MTLKVIAEALKYVVDVALHFPFIFIYYIFAVVAMIIAEIRWNGKCLKLNKQTEVKL